MIALPSSILLATYSGERWAIPVPRAFADSAISSHISWAKSTSAALATRISKSCMVISEIEKLPLNYLPFTALNNQMIFLFGYRDAIFFVSTPERVQDE